MSTAKISGLASSTGSAVTVAASNALRGTDPASIYSPGNIVQVQNTRSGPDRYSFSTLTPLVIPGLSITFTPKYANSLIQVLAYVSGSNTHVNSYGVFKDGVATVSTAGQTNTNEPNMQTTQYVGTTSGDYIFQVPIMYYETAGSKVARTYAIYVTSGWNGTVYATYVNNRASNDMASFSYMQVREIAQ